MYVCIHVYIYIYIYIASCQILEMVAKPNYKQTNET